MKKEPLYVLACYILWGLLPIFWKLLGGVNSIYVLSMRICWSMVFCSGLVLITKKAGALRAVFSSWRQVLLYAGCSIAVTCNWGFYIYAVAAGHLIECSLAYYLNPILSILLGFFFYQERLSALQWCAVGLAAVGVAVPVLRYGQVPYFALIIGGSFAIYSALKKKVTVDSEVSVLLETLFMVPLALGYVIWAETRGVGAVGVLHGWQWVLLPLTGIVTSVPLLFFGKGIRGTSLTLSGMFMYINPTLQLLLGVVLYHEAFTVTNGITFVFVAAAVAVFFGDSLRRRKAAAR